MTPKISFYSYATFGLSCQPNNIVIPMGAVDSLPCLQRWVKLLELFFHQYGIEAEEEASQTFLPKWWHPNDKFRLSRLQLPGRIRHRHLL